MTKWPYITAMSAFRQSREYWHYHGKLSVGWGSWRDGGWRIPGYISLHQSRVCVPITRSSILRYSTVQYSILAPRQYHVSCPAPSPPMARSVLRSNEPSYRVTHKHAACILHRMIILDLLKIIVKTLYFFMLILWLWYTWGGSVSLWLLDDDCWAAGNAAARIVPSITKWKWCCAVVCPGCHYITITASV